MDFTLDEEQQAVADLALQILTDKMTMERLMEIEASSEWFDRDAYAALAAAGLVGIALGEDVGGGGLDLTHFAQVLVAQGATVAPMPLLPTGLAALAIDRLGSDAQRQAILPGVVDGSTVLTVGIQEYLDDRLDQPSTRVSGGAATGQKIVVEFAEQASKILITATGDDGPGLYLVDLGGAGVSLTPGLSTRLEPVHVVDLEGAPAEQVGSGGVRWLLDHAVAMLCATQLGVTDKALRITAEYTSTREQFGRPIATFQAVTQRLADQYINVQGIRLCTLSAVYRLAKGEDASEDLHVAKWYGSERAQDIANATQHCHGGMGVSVDYPLHRYTLWNKHLTTSLGAGTQQLRTLGALMAV
jgi:alkylation response protein AidB-like acyl-CoA dehydrogenase